MPIAVAGLVRGAAVRTRDRGVDRRARALLPLRFEKTGPRRDHPDRETRR